MSEDISVEDVLMHFGVKGMRWGVINEDDFVGESLTSLEKSVLEKSGVSKSDSEGLNSKYGPESNTLSKPRGFTPNQKKLMLVGGIAAAVVGVAVANHYLGNNQVAKTTQEAATEFSKFWSDYSSASRKAMRWSIDDIDKLGGPLNFPKGSIFKRVSNAAEDSIRPGGFFAAFKDDDVNRYKAVLPTFWKRWGESTSDSGFVVSLKNNSEIKIPSVREAFDIWEKLIADDPKSAVSMNLLMRNSPLAPRDIALKTFGDLGTTWRERDMNDVTRRYFDAVKKAGYNALIDHNDVGKLADAPIRFLDGTLFDISGHEELTSDLIKTAQETIVRISHGIQFPFDQAQLSEILERVRMSQDISVEDVLIHFGVKGMKWGIRKGEIMPTDTTFGVRTHREIVLTKKLKNGGELNVIEKGFEDKNKVSQWLMSKSKLYQKNRANVHEFILKDKQGVDVGQATFFEDPKRSSMYLADIKIGPDHRRKGYAKATLQAGIAYAKEKQYSEINMISTPMGAPLYTSLGFKQLDGSPIDINSEVVNNRGSGWSEYTMKLSYDNVKHLDTNTSVDRFAELIVQYVNADPVLNRSETDKEATNMTDDTIEHFGVKGMKWGVTRKELVTQGYVGAVQSKHDRVNAQRQAEGKTELNSFGFPKRNTAKKSHETIIPASDSDIKSARAKQPAAEKKVLDAKRDVKSAKKTKSPELPKIKEKYDSAWDEYKKISDIANQETSSEKKESDEMENLLGTRPKKGAVHMDNSEDFLVQYDDSDVDDVLMHFGVKGMRWGHRRAEGELSPRQKNRELNKQFARDESARIIAKSKTEKNPVLAARARVYTGANHTRLKTAKEEYKKEKPQVGSKEARKKLDVVKRETLADYKKSKEHADGQELVDAIFKSFAGLAPTNEFEREFALQRKYRDY